jgi:hypothetical protein
MAEQKKGLKQLTKINAVPLRGGVDKVRDRVQLPFGSFSDVNNLRPMHPGFQQRKGMATKHTTADGSNECVTLYQFAKGRRVEKHFFAQWSDGDVHKATDLPPTVTTGAFGTEIHSGTASGMLPASWGTLADIMMYSNGTEQHQVYAGTDNYVHAFIKYDGSAAPGTIPTVGVDYTVDVTDGRTTTEAVLDDLNTIAAFECLYIMTPIPATQLTWTFKAGWVNTAAATGTLKYRKSDGTWADTAETDGTIITATKTLSGDGSMTWTAPTDEIPHYMFGRSGYWYQWETSAQLTDANGVRVTSLTYGHNSSDTFHSIANVWDGILPSAIEVILFDYNDGTDTSYYQLSPNDAELDGMVFSAGGTGNDCDILYWNSWDKSWGIYVDVGDTPHNDATTTILTDDLQYWTGTAWATRGTITDGTNGFRNSGFITYARTAEEPRQFNTGQYYSYWNRLWITGANLGADVRISIQTLPYFDIDDFGVGVTNGTWKDRPTYTFDRYGHYIHVGATNRPMSLNGTDYGILMAGDGRYNKVLCQKKFKNELVVFQEELGLEGGCVTLFEGYSPTTYGKLVLSTQVGTMSAKTVEVVEGVLTSTKTDEELKDLFFFLSRYGVCAADGKNIQVVSDQVQHHFDPTDTTNCIRYGYEKKMFLKYDSAYNGLRVGLVTGTTATTCNTFLFFDLVDKVWMYDTLGQNLSCMAEVEANSGNIPILQYGGGTNDGAVYRLNTGTNDVDIAAVTTPIDSYLTIELGYQGLVLAVRELLLRMKCQTAGNCTVTPYVNETALTDITMSMLAKTTGDASRRHRTGLKLQGDSISLRFRNATASQEMTLYDVGVTVYEMEGH